MTFIGPRDDLLTRTMLQIDAGTSSSSIANVVRALQRVPGVLLAEVNAESTRAIVAHDAGVPAASLVAAAADAGVRAKIIAAAPVAAPGATATTQIRRVKIRNLVTAAAAAFATLALLDLLVPNSAGKPWLLPAFLSAFWVFFFAQAIVAGRRP